MAAPVVSSTSTTSNFDNDDLTLTAPSGIQDGDLLIIVASVINVTTTMTPPAGFTSITSVSGVSFKIQAWYKVASSESGSYVVDTATGGYAGAAAMFRVTGDTTTLFNFDTDSVATVEESGAKSETATIKKQSPSLIINANVTGTQNWTSGSYTITHGGSNPTWTELIDAQDGGVDEGATAIAYTTTSDVTDITAWGFTSAGAGTSLWGSLLIVVLSEQNVTGTLTTLTSPPTLQSVPGSSGTTATLTTLTSSPTLQSVSGKGLGSTQWTNESVETTNWINET